MAIRVSKGALRELRRGHPWLFNESIEKQSFDGKPGDLAVVFDDDRHFVAIGLYDPGSVIRVRVLQHRTPAMIDAGFWRAAIEKAAAIREPLLQSEQTTAYRLVNGENDGLPGLILDLYEATVVCKVYSEAWLPHLAQLLGELDADSVGREVDTVVLRLARQVVKGQTHGLADGEVVGGSVMDAEPVVFRENGLRFEAHPLTGQKTGHFLDQRDNRRRVADLSRGKQVLDVFSCTGGFSVHAAAAGAESVHSVDLNPWAIETASRNFSLNSDVVSGCEHRSTVGDAFRVMENLASAGEKYDIVVVDPPSFAQREADAGRAKRAYSRLTELALPLVADRGVLVQASCSSRIGADEFFDLVLGTAVRAGFALDEVETHGHAIDHPVGFAEGAYLKAIFAEVRPL